MTFTTEIYFRISLLSTTYCQLTIDINKINKLTPVVDNQEASEVLGPLSLDEVWGIGPRRNAKLQAKGLQTIADGVDRGYPVFQELFGEYFGKIMYEMVAGKDRAGVLTDQLATKEQSTTCIPSEARPPTRPTYGERS